MVIGRRYASYQPDGSSFDVIVIGSGVGGVSVDLGDEQLQFDHVLLSCPLDEALAFIDASAEEQALFTQIRHVDYRTFACRVDGFVGQTGFIPAHFPPWKYFPHVSPQAMRDGHFDRLDQLQGCRHSYYIGELLNFATVGLTSEYADQLVTECF